MARSVKKRRPIWSGNTAGRLGAKVRRRRRFHIPVKGKPAGRDADAAASRQTAPVDAFGTILIAVSLLAAVIAAVSYWGSGRIYTGLGRGDLELERERPAAAATPAEAQEEIRQMLEAKSARREARGEAPLDVDAQLAELTSGAPGPGDPALREEVRQLVIARNERRLRQGKDPLDVEAEIDRQLRDIGG
jgi:hypothetical protein